MLIIYDARLVGFWLIVDRRLGDVPWDNRRPVPYLRLRRPDPAAVAVRPGRGL